MSADESSITSKVRGGGGNKENKYEGNEYEWDWVDGKDRESNRSEESWDEVSILN